MSDKKENTPQSDSDSNPKNDRIKTGIETVTEIAIANQKKTLLRLMGKKSQLNRRRSNNNRNKNRNRNRNKQRGTVKDVKASPLSDKESTYLKEQSQMFSENVKSGEIQSRTALVLEKPTIGITCGDLNGIGFELIIKTLENKEILDLCTPVIFLQARLLPTTKMPWIKRNSISLYAIALRI